MKHFYRIQILDIAYTIGLTIIASNSWAETSPPSNTVISPNKPAYLAANCTSCHSTVSKSHNIPSLTGLPASYISEQMQAFRDGKRNATVMHQIAKGYTAAQIEIIAGYFAAQPAPAQ